MLLGLGLSEADFERMLNFCPTSSDSGETKGGPNPHAVDILHNFLGAKSGTGSSLFFYAETESVEECVDFVEEYQESDPAENQQNPYCEAASPANAGATSNSSANEGDGPGNNCQEPGARFKESDDEESWTPKADIVGDTKELNLRTRKDVRTQLSSRLRCHVTSGNVPDTSQRVVYFVKTTSDEVAKLNSNSDHGIMTKAMEYGCLVGDCLTNLSAIMKEIFAPLLDHQLGLGVLHTGTGGDKSSPEAIAHFPRDPPKLGENLRNEFRANLHKFESQVAHATQQVKGDINLSVPDIDIDDPEIGNDFEAISILEGAMEEWSRLIAAVVEAENAKRVKGKGPTAEIEFWRRRNAALSALYEQINMPKVMTCAHPLLLLKSPRDCSASSTQRSVVSVYRTSRKVFFSKPQLLNPTTP